MVGSCCSQAGGGSTQGHRQSGDTGMNSPLVAVVGWRGC